MVWFVELSTKSAFHFCIYIFHPFTSWVEDYMKHLHISVTYKIASSTKFQQIHIFLSRLDIPATFFNVQCSVYFQVVEYYPCLDVYNTKKMFTSPYTSKECVLFVEEKKKKKWFRSSCAKSEFCSVSGQHIQSYSCYNTLCPGYTIGGIEPS